MKSKQQLLSETLELSIEEQIELARDILNNVAEYQVPHSLEISAEQRAELRRRLEEYRANPEEGIPWEEVLESIRASR